MKVLIACEYSGTVRDAFLREGHDAISCDILDTESPGPHYKGDVLDIIDDGWDLMVAHPPCTRLTNAGVRWLHRPPKGKTLEQMWKELEEGIEFYCKLRDSNIPRKAIENPIMHRYAREAIKSRETQVVQPWHFGHKQLKAIGLELINLPRLVYTDVLTPPKAGTAERVQWAVVHNMSPGPNRSKARSRFFKGVADAMATQWGRDL